MKIGQPLLSGVLNLLLIVELLVEILERQFLLVDGLIPALNSHILILHLFLVQLNLRLSAEYLALDVLLAFLFLSQLLSQLVDLILVVVQLDDQVDLLLLKLHHVLLHLLVLDQRAVQLIVDRLDLLVLLFELTHLLGQFSLLLLDRLGQLQILLVGVLDLGFFLVDLSLFILSDLDLFSKLVLDS